MHIIKIYGPPEFQIKGVSVFKPWAVFFFFVIHEITNGW